MSLFLSWLYWNPERVVFTVPYIDRPVVWYGLWFVFGFLVGYFILVPIVAHKLQTSRNIPEKEAKTLAQNFVDKMTWFVVAGTIIGARLGHVFFYDWPHYQANLSEIYKVWTGGLASHGGAVGVLIALFLFLQFSRKKYPEINFLNLLDSVVIPTAFVGCCIRIGNFFNQELLGKSTTVLWAVVFGDPYDGTIPEPRHPVQLYEAFFYLITFFILLTLWKYKKEKIGSGLFSGLFFVLIFGSRFIIDFWKMPQGLVIDEAFLQTGQYLSIPFILAGLWLLMRKNNLRTYAKG